LKSGDSVKVEEDGRHFIAGDIGDKPITEATIIRRIGGSSSKWYMVYMTFGLDTQVVVMPDDFLKKM